MHKYICTILKHSMQYFFFSNSRKSPFFQVVKLGVPLNPFVGIDAIVRQSFFPYLSCSDLESESHSVIFGLAESDFEVKIWEFKMAAPIWRTKVKNFT